MMVSDTCRHTYKNAGMYSKSLKSMCHQYGVRNKGGIDEWEWEQAYAGDYEILKRVEAYNKLDVDCVLELRPKMISAGHLRPPRLWTP